MSTKFVLSSLAKLLSAANRRRESTLLFEIEDGRGRFLFMMYFAPEDTEAKDKLYLVLRNTNVTLELKLYGSFNGGGTHCYLNRHEMKAIIDELDLQGMEPGFSFSDFLVKLNSLIPPELSQADVVRTWRRVAPNLGGKLSKFVDDDLKRTLVGIVRLPPNKAPRERTLRKLYRVMHESDRAVASLIDSLKRSRITLAWSAAPDAVNRSFADIQRDIATPASK